MANGKYSRKRGHRGAASKTLTVILAVCLLIGTAIGGTIAWLTDTSDEIANEFTIGDINIELDETTGTQYKIIPGVDIEKDPKVTVLANSEACWLFVSVVENNWPDFVEADGTTRKVDYEIADGWEKLETGVYYRQVPNSTSDQPFSVLKDNTVSVSGTLTKGEAEQITVKPTLTFKAYAIQQPMFETASAAWAEITK